MNPALNHRYVPDYTVNTNRLRSAWATAEDLHVIRRAYITFLETCEDDEVTASLAQDKYQDLRAACLEYHGWTLYTWGCVIRVEKWRYE